MGKFDLPADGSPSDDRMPGADWPRSEGSLPPGTNRLAKEICGDCVPREFAPSLRGWMDQIQRLASEVKRIYRPTSLGTQRPRSPQSLKTAHFLCDLCALCVRRRLEAVRIRRRPGTSARRCRSECPRRAPAVSCSTRRPTREPPRARGVRRKPRLTERTTLNRSKPRAGGCQPTGSVAHAGTSKMSCIGRRFSMCTVKSAGRCCRVSFEGGFSRLARRRSTDAAGEASCAHSAAVGHAASTSSERWRQPRLTAGRWSRFAGPRPHSAARCSTVRRPRALPRARWLPRARARVSTRHRPLSRRGIFRSGFRSGW